SASRPAARHGRRDRRLPRGRRPSLGARTARGPLLAARDLLTTVAGCDLHLRPAHGRCAWAADRMGMVDRGLVGVRQRPGAIRARHPRAAPAPGGLEAWTLSAPRLADDSDLVPR